MNPPTEMKRIYQNSGPFLCLLVALSPVRTVPAQSDGPDERLREYEQYALTHSGDAERGRELFAREQVTKCLICHRIGERGGQVGPDLSRIGGKFDRPHLIESLLEPSRQIVEGYRPSLILLNNGRTLTGIVKERTERQLTLLDSDAKIHTIATADIDRQATADVSLMPTGLEKVISPEDLTDLVAYMETLRSGSSTKHGAGITGPIRVPPGFEVSTVSRDSTVRPPSKWLPTDGSFSANRPARCGSSWTASCSKSPSSRFRSKRIGNGA